MDHDLGIGQRDALTLRAGGQQKRAHRRRHTDADGRHVALDILHRVVDRHTVRDGAAGAVDIHLDVLVGVLRFEIQKLCHDETGGRAVDFLTEKYDAVVQQAGKNVIGAFSAGRLFYNIRYETHEINPPLRG